MYNTYTTVAMIYRR